MAVAWWHSDMLGTFSFIDHIFAHAMWLLDVTTQLKFSTHTAFGLAVNGT